MYELSRLLALVDDESVDVPVIDGDDVLVAEEDEDVLVVDAVTVL